MACLPKPYALPTVLICISAFVCVADILSSFIRNYPRQVLNLPSCGKCLNDELMITVLLATKSPSINNGHEERIGK